MAQLDNYESALFDVLEALKHHFPMIGGGFARDTGGVDLAYILSILANSRDAGSTTREGGEGVLGQSGGDPDGWVQVKVNSEGGIVAPYGRMSASPDHPHDGETWAPFFFGTPR